jgi:hypothetical protein
MSAASASATRRSGSPSWSSATPNDTSIGSPWRVNALAAVRLRTRWHTTAASSADVFGKSTANSSPAQR